MKSIVFKIIASACDAVVNEMIILITHLLYRLDWCTSVLAASCRH